MITYAQALLLGLLQGLAELFPISSLGHTVIIPQILGWHLEQASDQFVGFVVFTHLATALVLFAFFWRDWWKIITGVLGTLKRRRISAEDTYGKLGWLLVVSTVPAGILGLLFEERLKLLFATPLVVAGALTLNGLVLFSAELLRRKAAEGAPDDHALAGLSFRQSIGIGLLQCGALIPGFSRTGLTMTGGLVNGLSHENAVRYSFLLATPIIFAAAVLKVPDVFVSTAALGPALVGGLAAAVAAYFSTRFLVKYFETRTLKPFAIYCIAFGVLSLILVVR